MVSINPMDLSHISFAQAGTIVLEKTLESVQLEDKSIRVQLSQAETLLFADSSLVEIQIRVRLTDGNALASDIISTSCERILKDGTI